MASDPGALTPKGEAKRRLRRGARRAHLDIAPALPNEPSADTSEGADARESEQVEATAKPKSRSTAGTGAFLRKNVRLVLAAVFLGVGVLLVILGWYGAANTNILTEQIPYFISGGLLGMALIITAGVIGSSAALERENRELRRDLMHALASAPMRSEGSGNPMSAPRRSDDGHVYIVPGGRSYHFAGCPIVEGKDGSELTMPEAVSAGFAACKLCGTD
jgi:hypothetical protein